MSPDPNNPAKPGLPWQGETNPLAGLTICGRIDELRLAGSEEGMRLAKLTCVGSPMGVKTVATQLNVDR